MREVRSIPNGIRTTSTPKCPGKGQGILRESCTRLKGRTGCAIDRDSVRAARHCMVFRVAKRKKGEEALRELNAGATKVEEACVSLRRRLERKQLVKHGRGKPIDRSVRRIVKLIIEAERKEEQSRLRRGATDRRDRRAEIGWLIDDERRSH